MNRNIFLVVVLFLILFVVVGCLCLFGVFAVWNWSTVRPTGQQATAPETYSLRQVLESGAQATFSIGQDCQYPQATGSLLETSIGNQSQPNPQNLSERQAIRQARDWLDNAIFLVDAGRVYLHPQTPVPAQYIGEEGVSLIYVQHEENANQQVTRNLDAIITEASVHGSYHLTQTSHPDENNPDQESLNLDVEFICPLDLSLLPGLPPTNTLSRAFN